MPCCRAGRFSRTSSAYRSTISTAGQSRGERHLRAAGGARRPTSATIFDYLGDYLEMRSGAAAQRAISSTSSSPASSTRTASRPVGGQGQHPCRPHLRRHRHHHLRHGRCDPPPRDAQPSARCAWTTPNHRAGGRGVRPGVPAGRRPRSHATKDTELAGTSSRRATSCC